jgi:hypothetical protein
VVRQLTACKDARCSSDITAADTTPALLRACMEWLAQHQHSTCSTTHFFFTGLHREVMALWNSDVAPHDSGTDPDQSSASHTRNSAPTTLNKGLRKARLTALLYSMTAPPHPQLSSSSCWRLLQASCCPPKACLACLARRRLSEGQCAPPLSLSLCKTAATPWLNSTTPVPFPLHSCTNSLCSTAGCGAVPALT